MVYEHYIDMIDRNLGIGVFIRSSLNDKTIELTYLNVWLICLSCNNTTRSDN